MVEDEENLFHYGVKSSAKEKLAERRLGGGENGQRKQRVGLEGLAFLKRFR